MQVDVIEVGYRRLRARVEAAGDYRAAVAAHGAFVDGVVAAAFLDVRNLQVSCQPNSECIPGCADCQTSNYGRQSPRCLPSAADTARDTGLHCVSLPLHNIAHDRRSSFPAGAWMQATLMALFSLCRRLCARLQVGFGCRHWLMTFQIKCHC